MKRLSLGVLTAGLLLTSCHAGRKATSGAAIPAERKKIIQTAVKFMGTPYRYGGTTPEKGFDCSGFVQYVFALHDVKLPRTTSALYGCGKEVSLERARVADLILFTGSNASGPVGHVGIITKPAGKDTEFIHAGSSGKMGGVVIGSLSNSYFSKRFLKVIDVLK